ncbi:MAG: aspartyl/glutamyl-tRNA amidotransferase subunit A [Candidatus Komeilibacteria bacterium RIFOXYC1_FULL_37_11]|uniref:Glutamyl-tRNA(Gln) amidotransferase subunit A n=1 Tax=Candidatus Komeilibacteria bacterium RIFOXYC1_FULL_37_11 TaxID=1798555 RepID=A0A1G2BXN5_9BACT|nr:MAG: aspartyl/glutamyl-tRNA amidotransferase subunit A [Candidatus Komeilibacteria bacterium RIFOXYC1_FULL_37_11]OGY95894.1 MAG: aspartyl/glutamyl-tRNA amidotransferase subunit A [Candidatus Komeilibacteria bacterium RIFOXYD1_FULL_37_29]
MDLEKLNIEEIHQALSKKIFSSEELTKKYLARIKQDDTNAFISLNENALDEAKAADQKIKSGQAGVLVGVPLAVKDVILVAGQKATAASKILENYTASYTATAVARLKAAGMVILGKTNCDEFAMGSSNENSYFGPVLNPHDKSRVPGGSSGGSAVAVAANLAPVSLGTDTGGSIRQPAAFCGVVGLKPSYGRVSRYGAIAMASSLDQIGPLAKTVKDTAYLLHQMAGFDKYDATSSTEPVADYLKDIDKDVKKIRLGIPEEYFLSGIDPAVRQAVEGKINFLEKAGFKIKAVKLPYTEYGLAAYYLLMPAEVSSNLARYDGILYGMSPDKNLSLDDWYKSVRSQGFGSETKRRIILGTYILSAGYFDAYYKKAQKLRSLIKNDFANVFKQVDALLTPVTPTTAFKIGEKSKDPLSMYLSDIFTVGANIAGICGLSLPIGQDKNNLPIGLQILAKPFAEDILFKLGYYIENNY